jgi:hypothetical protein
VRRENQQKMEGGIKGPGWKMEDGGWREVAAGGGGIGGFVLVGGVAIGILGVWRGTVFRKSCKALTPTHSDSTWLVTDSDCRACASEGEQGLTRAVIFLLPVFLGRARIGENRRL